MEAAHTEVANESADVSERFVDFDPANMEHIRKERDQQRAEAAEAAIEHVLERLLDADPPENDFTIYMFMDKTGFTQDQSRKRLEDLVDDGVLVKQLWHNKNWYWEANDE